MKSVVALIIPYALSAAIGAVAGLLGASCSARFRPAAPAQPDIRVVDMRRIVETIARDPSLDDAGRHARTQEISDVISRFVADQSEQGILILDGSAVLRAPASLYIEPAAVQ